MTSAHADLLRDMPVKPATWTMAQHSQPCSWRRAQLVKVGWASSKKAVLPRV